MKTEPFRPFLTVLLAAVIAGCAPALADGQPTGPDSAVVAEPGTVPPQEKPDKPASTTLQGLHLKLGNVELKVRGPVILDAGPNQADTSGQGH